MRLGISLLLVTLALCCYQANALVCPSLLGEITTLLDGTEDSYVRVAKTFNPPPEAIQAKLEVKKCIDQMSWSHKFLLQEIMVKIVAKCDLPTLF